MPIELEPKEARGLMRMLTGVILRPGDVEEHRYGENRRYTTEKGLFRIYAENDWLHKDGRFHVGVQNKLSGERLEILFTPTFREDLRAEGVETLRHDLERREYWVRQVGVEAAKREVDEIWKRITFRPGIHDVPKEWLSTPERRAINDNQ